MSERIDHAAEAIRLIDSVLAEETVVLDGLKLAVAQNGITEQEADDQFTAHRLGHPQPTMPDGAAA